MKKTLLVAFVILCSTFVLYYFLDGFRPIEFTEVSLDKPYVLAGQPYKGPQDAQEVARIFQELKLLDHPARQDSTIIIVSYDAGTDEDNVDLFIAVRLRENVQIDDLEVVELGAKHVCRTTMKGHPLVLPNAEKLLKQAKEFAEANQWKTDGYSVETYFPDGTIRVDVPLIR